MLNKINNLTHTVDALAKSDSSKRKIKDIGTVAQKWFIASEVSLLSSDVILPITLLHYCF